MADNATVTHPSFLQPLFIEIYGDYGTGKTSLALQAPNPLLIDTSPHMEALSIVRKYYPSDFLNRYVHCTDFDSILSVINNLRVNNENKFKTVIIDTSTLLLEYATQKFINDLNQQGKKRIRPLPQEYGYIYQLINNLITTIISPTQLFMNLIFTARMTEEIKVTVVDDREIIQKTGKLVRDGYKHTPAYADLRIKIDLIKTEKDYQRKYVVVKNRFRDRVNSNEWIDELVIKKISDFWSAIKQLTQLGDCTVE
ncbi:MAG: AAA family ATPase [Candidatus Nitrosocaldaceae archaeon]